MDTEGRTAGTTAATSSGAEMMEALTDPSGRTGSRHGNGGCVRRSGWSRSSLFLVSGRAGRYCAGASDIFASKSRPAWLLPFVAVMRTGTEPELAIHRMPSTCATPEASV